MSDLPRSVWNGTLRLRDLVVPVGLAPTRGRNETQFKLIHDGCGQLIQQERACPAHGKVPDEELVKGWEVAPGEYVPIDVDGLNAVAPADSRSINLFAIVRADSIDPLLVTRAYFLTPDKRSRAGREGYAAIEQALRLEGLTALGRFTAWGTEHLGAIDARRYELVLRELAEHTELRDATAVADLVAEVELDDVTSARARTLVRRLEVPFEPQLLTNLHRQRVQEFLDAQLRGEKIFRAPPAADAGGPGASGDVAAALKLSLEGIPRGRRQRLEQALATRA